jgi:hypothetical protein
MIHWRQWDDSPLTGAEREGPPSRPASRLRSDMDRVEQILMSESRRR